MVKRYVTPCSKYSSSHYRAVIYPLFCMCLLTVDMVGCHVTPDRFRSLRSSDGCAGMPASFRYRKQHLETAVDGAWETDEIQKEEFDFNCVALMTKIK